MMERLAPEQHDTLDEVPEPSENPLLVGHHAARDAIAGSYRAGKFPHGLMLVGSRGIGKATLAFHAALHLLKHPDFMSAPAVMSLPDRASSLFRQVASGAHPGVLHLTRPLNERTKAFKSALTVDEIRRISRFLSMTSHDGSYRVVIVDPADDMNANAANALLKNLEEPPARTLFVLIVNSPGSLLPTIRSRCQVLRLSPLDDGELAEALRATGFEPPNEPDRMRLLAQRAGGSVRQALLLTQYGGLDIADSVDSLISRGKIGPPDAHKLADAVSKRDSTVQFEMFNEHLLDVVSDAAKAAGQAGDLTRANRMSGLWQDMRVAINQTQTYNLDRKQHALNMISRLNDTFRM